MKLLLIILGVLILLASVKLLSSNGGLAEYWVLQQRLLDIEQANKIQAAENALLTQEVRDLQSGTMAIETIARQQLGLLGDNEVFIKLLEVQPSQGYVPSLQDENVPLVVENPQPINRLE